MFPQLTTQQQARVIEEVLAFASKAPPKQKDYEEDLLRPVRGTPLNTVLS
jgi:hypothetical protein